MKLFLPLVALTLLVGCAGFRIKGFGAPEVRPVFTSNPLSGRVCAASVEPAASDLQVMTADRCSYWPVTDEYQVEAAGDRLCVTVQMNVLSYESGPWPVDRLTVGISVDSAPARFFEALATGPMRKVGHCYGADRLMTGVWVTELTGCAPNDALLKPRSRTLSVRVKKGGLFAEAEGIERARFEFVDVGAAIAAARETEAPPRGPPSPAPRAQPSAPAETQRAEARPRVLATAPTPMPRAEPQAPTATAASHAEGPIGAAADTILRTRDGRTMKGRVLSETRAGYLFRSDSATEVIAYSNIDDLERLERPATATATVRSQVASPPVAAGSSPATSANEEVDWRAVRKGLHPSIGVGSGFAYSRSSTGSFMTALPALSYGFGWVDVAVTAAVSAGTHSTLAADIQARVNFRPRYSLGAGAFVGYAFWPNEGEEAGVSFSPAIVKLGGRGQHQLFVWLGSGTRSGLALRTGYAFSF